MGNAPQTTSAITVSVPDHRVDHAARGVTRRGIGPFSGVLGGYYLFMSAFHVAFGGDGVWVLLAGACAATALVLWSMTALFQRSIPPRSHAYAWVVFVASLVIANITLFQVVSGDQRNVVNYALVNVIAGVLVFSRPVLFGILVVDALAWLLAERLNPVGDVAFDGGFIAGTWLLALGLSWISTQALSRAEALRLQAEIALDSSERRLEQRDRAIQAHRRSQEGLRRLIELSQQCVVIVQAGEIAYVNRAFRETMGMRGQALVGQTIQDLVHHEDRDLADLELLVQESGLGVELRFPTSQGEVVPLDVTATTMEYGEGPAIMLILTDERSLDTPDRQALANRMLAVGTLAAGVAHEINNPLAYTIANLEMLQIELGSSEKSTLVETALEGAGRVRDIVADLRRFSREDEESMTTVDLEELLQTSIRMAWNEIRHRAHLERDFGGVSGVMGNASRLGQVFLNLLLNAAQAIPDGDASSEVITVRTSESADWVTIEFEDTGDGIPAALREQIFKPFFTTKPLGVGTGLGLPYCRNAVEQLGGAIEVESEVGRGSVFRVRLPRGELRPGEPATGQTSDALASGIRRILLIDDEAQLAEAIVAVLAPDEVVVASSGPEALERIGEGWDAVLCDVMMPEMSGPEVYRRIVAERPELALRIAFVTGGTFTDSTREFLERTTAPVLTKPFRAHAIRALVDQLVKA